MILTLKDQLTNSSNTTKDNSFRKGFSYLRLANEYFMDATRQSPNIPSGILAARYTAKIVWIELDFKSSPKIPSAKFYDLNVDMSTEDSMYLESINRKIALLNTIQKTAVEGVLDMLIAGEETIIQIQ